MVHLLFFYSSTHLNSPLYPYGNSTASIRVRFLHRCILYHKNFLLATYLLAYILFLQNKKAAPAKYGDCQAATHQITVYFCNDLQKLRIRRRIQRNQRFYCNQHHCCHDQRQDFYHHNNEELLQCFQLLHN